MLFVHRSCVPHIRLTEQLCCAFFTPRVRQFIPRLDLRWANDYTLSSDPLSSQTLAKDDVVKLHLGAQIDGFAAISAETIVIGASAENPVTGRFDIKRYFA